MSDSLSIRIQTGALLFLLANSAYSASNDALPASVLEAWETTWNQQVGEIIDGIIRKLDEESFLEAEYGKKTAALHDIRQLYEHELSWDNVGERTVAEYLESKCGRTLIEKIVPYYSGASNAESADNEIVSEYRNCSSDLDLHISTSAAYGMLEISSKKLTPILRRHGIEPQ